MASTRIDPNARYAKTHEWVRIEDNIAVVGITDAAQDMLSDVVYVELPVVGDSVEAGSKVADVESVKAAEEVIAPVSGKIIAVNSDLEKTPELVNTAPYAAWFVKIEPTDALESELASLMTPEAYDQFVQENAH